MATKAQIRRRQRALRQRQRQKARTQRRATRQEKRTRRVLGRQNVRTEKIAQKGASGFWTPQGIEARGKVAGDLVGQGLDIAKMFGAGGLSGLIPETSRREEIIDLFDTNGTPAYQPSMGGGGGGGGFALAPEEEEKPIWKNPLVIGGALVGGFLLYRTMSKRK